MLTVCFVAGALFDYVNFFPVGRSSILLLVIFYIYYLYERKFKENNRLFKIGSFIIAAIIFNVLIGKLHVNQLFWWTFFYFLAEAAHRAYGK
jgi:cell shape-determining protein MreD